MSGCTGTKTELEMTNYDAAQDHRKIAAYYMREAVKFRAVSEDLSDRVALYERLFGPTSDWVVGTRLLAQSYEERAKEHERKAGKHLELVNNP